MHVRRLHKQHGSRVIVVPKPVCRAMRAKPGDYLMFKEVLGTGVFVIAKIHEGDYQNVKHSRHLNRQD